jgi:hypothetical protein
MANQGRRKLIQNKTCQTEMKGEKQSVQKPAMAASIITTEDKAPIANSNRTYGRRRSAPTNSQKNEGFENETNHFRLQHGRHTGSSRKFT